MKDAEKNFAAIQREREGARVPKATPDTGGVVGLETHRVADCNPPNAELSEAARKT